MLDATPLLRFYARRRARRLAGEDAPAAQRHVLLRLLRHAADTRFGAAHGFAAIDDVATYQRRVRLRHYDDFWHEYWRAAFPVLTDLCWPGTIPYFARTSGTTTGATKFIPVSRAMNASNGRAVLDLFTHHLAARPRSRVLAGRNFMLGGSTALTEEAPGIVSGDLSGIAAREVPWWARPRVFPPREEALIADWETKIDTLARLSLEAEITSLSGTPSWLLLFFARLATLRPELPRRSASYFPKLELLIHGGVNFAPYRRQFEDLLAGSHAELREVYAASEGFIAVADRGSGEGLRLIADNGIFYEFVPVAELDAAAPTRHWLATIERGVDYAIVLTTCAGLWSYVLGDTVRFVAVRPPRLVVTGRLSYALSAFGEHLIGEEIEAAVAAAAAAVDRDVADFTVTAVFPAGPDERGGHRYIVEFTTPIDERGLAAFARALDDRLAAANEDYRAHRAGGYGMAPPGVAAVMPGAFARWLKTQGRLGGQNKVPRVVHDATAFRALEEFLRRERAIYATAP
ncbi:MAG TPA: GH3 auxin-responsive promoter family protein [Stellaceae bacterium]|nr:GH3 auxin-responsive promoter family protein [Stellaceae bacterium]